MAIGKNVFANLFCSVTGGLIKTIYFAKSKFSVGDFEGTMKYSKYARKRVPVVCKIAKKGN